MFYTLTIIIKYHKIDNKLQTVRWHSSSIKSKAHTNLKIINNE